MSFLALLSDCTPPLCFRHRRQGLVSICFLGVFGVLLLLLYRRVYYEDNASQCRRLFRYRRTSYESCRKGRALFSTIDRDVLHDDYMDINAPTMLHAQV